jgi:hypothetical protein
LVAEAEAAATTPAVELAEAAAEVALAAALVALV